MRYRRVLTLVRLISAIALLGGTLAPRAAHAIAPPHSVYWRVVGHVSENDREFHFVVTFGAIVVPGAGSSRAVYLAGYAITGDDPHAFVHEERLDRPGLGDSSLRATPLDLHVDDWGLHPATHTDSLRLVVEGARGAIDLTLRGRPQLLPLFSDRDRSRELPATGTLRIDGTRHAVRGFATIECIDGGENDLPGADWSSFDIALDDGRSITIVARRDGADRTRSVSGAMQTRDGQPQPLLPSAIDVSEWGRCAWTSPTTGAQYPTVWDLSLAGAHIGLVVQATVREQEIVPSIGGPAFWEGAADVIDQTTDAHIGWAIVTMRGIGSHPLPCGG